LFIWQASSNRMPGSLNPVTSLYFFTCCHSILCVSSCCNYYYPSLPNFIFSSGDFASKHTVSLWQPEVVDVTDLSRLRWSFDLRFS
jgi:hypothetical protein